MEDFGKAGAPTPQSGEGSSLLIGAICLGITVGALGYKLGQMIGSHLNVGWN